MAYSTPRSQAHRDHEGDVSIRNLNVREKKRTILRSCKQRDCFPSNHHNHELPTNHAFMHHQPTKATGPLCMVMSGGFVLPLNRCD
mmetsp:Transcript_15663/g.23158  ORF Transcript_15663/g.23158 Transcript_15663/m.23158 type:complete len:86 (-) Transcript_15663:66-323(-)